MISNLYTVLLWTSTRHRSKLHTAFLICYYCIHYYNNYKTNYRIGHQNQLSVAFPLQLIVNSADCHPWRGKHRLSWDHFATSDNDGWYCGPLPTKPADTGHSCLQWGRKRSHCAWAMVPPLRADSTVTIYCQWLLGSPQVTQRGMQWDGTAASLGQMFIIERSWSFPFNLVFPWIAQGQDEPLFFFSPPSALADLLCD